jgi:hypothetical protein
MPSNLRTIDTPFLAFSEVEKSSHQLPQVIKQGYSWFSQQNQHQALDYLEGLLFLSQQQLIYQEQLYKQQIIEVIAKDMAERTGALVASRTGYNGRIYYQAEPIPATRFETPRFRSDTHGYQWVYTSIECYAALIPPQAVRAMALLQQAGITPGRLWVGDLQEIRMRRSVDPVLCAQFGPWFIAIAEWV